MKKIKGWQILYAVCCLVYMGWVTKVGTTEFDRINSQYRRIVEQLDARRIKVAALEELRADCRRESSLRAGHKEDVCVSWPPAVVEAREKAVAERLARARERGIVKVVLFYTGFVFIFLLAPPILIYLFIAGVLALYKNIKFVR